MRHSSCLETDCGDSPSYDRDGSFGYQPCHSLLDGHDLPRLSESVASSSFRRFPYPAYFQLYKVTSTLSISDFMIYGAFLAVFADLASFARVPDVIVLKDDSHAFTSILDLEVLEEITLEGDLKA